MKEDLSNNVEISKQKERLNLYFSSDLMKRLKYCAERYGVSHGQLAIMLIGQGVASIEKSFSIIDDVTRDLITDAVEKKQKQD